MAIHSGAMVRAPFALSGLRLQALVYLAVSVIALGCDAAAYFALAALGAGAAAAGAVGYMLGIGVHYGLSRAVVFDTQAAGKTELRLFAEFVASGLMGLTMTVAVIWVAVEGLGLALLPAKIGAVAVSFGGVFLIRRFVVFRG